jgi:hypothetical protein
VLCVKRLYNGSVLPVTKREILQSMFMLGQYQHPCLVEEFQKLKASTPIHNLLHKKEAVLIGHVFSIICSLYEEWQKLANVQSRYDCHYYYYQRQDPDIKLKIIGYCMTVICQNNRKILYWIFNDCNNFAVFSFHL